MTTLACQALGVAVEGVPVLHEVALEARPGAVLGVIGPNGAGKTTLLRALLGRLRPTSGSVRLDGRPLGDHRPRELARRLAFVAAEPHVGFAFRVLELVLMGRAPYLGRFGLEGARDVALAREALAACDAIHLEQRLFHTLSSGEAQRVVLARALCQTPAVLLLDEPTVHLDLSHEVALFRLLRARCREGLCVVVVLHDLQLAARWCDELALLCAGRVMAHGAVRAVLTAANLERAYGVRVALHETPAGLAVLPEA